MSKLVRQLPWLMAGAALYHLGLMLKEQRELRLTALLRQRETESRRRRFFQRVTACDRGQLNN